MELSGDTSKNKVGYRYGHSITGLLGRPPKSTASEKGYRYPLKSVELSGDTSMKKILGIVTTTIVGLLARPPRSAGGEMGYRYPSKPDGVVWCLQV